MPAIIFCHWRVKYCILMSKPSKIQFNLCQTKRSAEEMGALV